MPRQAYLAVPPGDSLQPFVVMICDHCRKASLCPCVCGNRYYCAFCGFVDAARGVVTASVVSCDHGRNTISLFLCGNRYCAFCGLIDAADSPCCICFDIVLRPAHMAVQQGVSLLPLGVMICDHCRKTSPCLCVCGNRYYCAFGDSLTQHEVSLLHLS